MKTRISLGAMLIALFGALGLAQTKVTPPSNKYTVAQDGQLGREAATEVRGQLPIMKDDAVTSFVENLGRRLAATGL